MPPVIDTPAFIKCLTCRKTKPSFMFHNNRTRSTGKHGSCALCATKRSSEYYYKNKKKNPVA